MVKGALGVLGASALLAISCAQAFALDPVPTVPVPTVSVPAVTVPVPTVSVPTVTTPTATVSVPTVTTPTATVSVPTVTTPTATVTGATASSPSTSVSAPSASLPGSSTSSDSSVSSSGTGGSASGLSAGTGGSASGSSGQQSSQGGGDGTRSARSGSGSVRRFEARPPKFRSRGKNRRGTTLVVWLSSDSLVAFSIVQVAPNCRGVGGFTRAGTQGKNRFSFSGRLDGHALSAGTYRIRVAAVQGQKVTSVRRETVVVVAPGQSIQSAHAQKSTCGPGEEAAEDRAEIAAFVDLQSPATGGSTVAPWAHGGASGSNGAVVAPESLAPPANFLLQPRVPKLGITSDVDEGWSPLALSTLGAMVIVLFVITGRELAERYRGRAARWR